MEKTRWVPCDLEGIELIECNRYLGDPIEKGSDGFWYFHDEDWLEVYGPYTTERGADEACHQYAKERL